MEKIKDFARQYIGFIMVAVISIIYVCTAFLQIDTTGKSYSQIIGDGFVAFVLGFFINRMFDIQGISSGENNPKYIATLSLHGEWVDKISPYIDRLDSWCDKKNKENLKIQRTRLLATEGMAYSDYFDEEGKAKGYTRNPSKNSFERREDRARIRCYKNAVKLKLTPITASDLTSEGQHNFNDPYNFGQTKKDFLRKGSCFDLFSKVIIACVIGYYGVSVIADFDKALLLWNCLQVSLFILMGAIKMLNSYLFIIGEYRGRVVKKINQLEMFLNETQGVRNE